MNQPGAIVQMTKIALLACLLLPVWFGAGCDQSPPAAQRGQAPGATKSVKVASISPAATDLLVGLGLGDRLVGVSNFEPPREETGALPKIGDYRTVDWERLAAVKPDVLIVQYDPAKLPPGLMDRASAMNVRVLNIEIETLADILATADLLVAELEAPKSVGRLNSLQMQLGDVSRRVEGKPRPRTLMVVGESGLSLAGKGTFLDDLLQLAGGQNTMAEGPRYPSIDREKLLAMDPEVVLQFLPGATEQVLQQSREFWEALPQLAAVRNKRVYTITEPNTLLPGWCVLQTTRIMAEKLHPEGG